MLAVCIWSRNTPLKMDAIYDIVAVSNTSQCTGNSSKGDACLSCQRTFYICKGTSFYCCRFMILGE